MVLGTPGEEAIPEGAPPSATEKQPAAGVVDAPRVQLRRSTPWQGVPLDGDVAVRELERPDVSEPRQPWHPPAR